MDESMKREVDEMIAVAEYMLPRAVDLIADLFDRLVEKGLTRAEAIELLKGQQLINKTGG